MSAKSEWPTMVSDPFSGTILFGINAGGNGQAAPQQTASSPRPRSFAATMVSDPFSGYDTFGTNARGLSSPRLGSFDVPFAQRCACGGGVVLRSDQ
jgi:hypothetical protein